MGNDTPDWGGQYNTQSFYPLSDLAELAVRLGSPITLDRRGSLIWQETFEHGLIGVSTNLSGATSTVTLSVTTPINPPFCCQLFTHPTTNSYAEVYQFVPRSSDPNLGAAAWIYSAQNFTLIDLKLGLYTGANEYEGRIRLIPSAAGEAQVKTGGSFTTIPGTSGIGISASGWRFVKVVIDADLLTYRRLIFGGAEIDLSAYAMQLNGPSTLHGADLSIRATAPGDINHTVLVDTMAITAAEPPNA